MTVRIERPGVLHTLGNHETRTRNLEHAIHGPWEHPTLINGWENVGGSAVPMRYRWLIGGGFAIQGSIGGGDLGTVAFVIAIEEIRPDYEIRLNGSDDDGNLVVWVVYPNGNVQVGV